MKKTKIVIVPIIISLLLVTMSMLLSGCSLINETTYFGIPTGYYDLVEGNATHKDYKIYVGQTLIGNEIKYNVHYDVSQDENGFIYMLHDVGYHVYSHKVIYFYEKELLVVGFPNVLVFKQKNTRKIDNFGIPKGTYNLIEEDLLENSEMPTELVVDGGVEFGGVKYDFSQDEDGKINILNSETTDKKQIIYFYKYELLEVRWNEDSIFHFKQNETK